MSAAKPRKEFELTAEQFDKLIEACRPTTLIMLQCGMPRSPQENANDAWCALGKELGFDGMTVEPSSKGQRFFTAVPTTARSAEGAV
jgi:hypothetical protein